MNVMPVAKQRKHQQQKCDQQQSGSFRRVNRVPPMLVIVLGIGSGHGHIVRRRCLDPGRQGLGVGSDV